MPRMRFSLAHSLPLLTIAAILQSHPLTAAETMPVLLRYRFAAGQTNAYNLQIEAQGESGREAIAGTFVVSARAVATNLIGLSWRDIDRMVAKVRAVTAAEVQAAFAKWIRPGDLVRITQGPAPK